jgi:cathepsin B
MLDCDKNDQGCDGGYLDDAWEFLMNTGIPSETCLPYTHCEDPATPDCKPKMLDTAPSCPTTCTDGSALKLHKATSAYHVAKPGDVNGMQKEILQNGPIEVAFFVYSDFQTYQVCARA